MLCCILQEWLHHVYQTVSPLGFLGYFIGNEILAHAFTDQIPWRVGGVAGDLRFYKTQVRVDSTERSPVTAFTEPVRRHSWGGHQVILKRYSVVSCFLVIYRARKLLMLIHKILKPPGIKRRIRWVRVCGLQGSVRPCCAAWTQSSVNIFTAWVSIAWINLGSRPCPSR